MISSLVLAAALTLQGQQEIRIQVPAPQYRVEIQQIQPQYYYYVKPVQVQPVIPLRPGDMLIPHRVGLFGWRTEYRLYRR